MYLLDAQPEGDGPEAQLLASGVGVPWARHARELLAEDWGVRANVWSVTSWTELRKEALEAEKHNLLHPEEPRTPWISQRLEGVSGRSEEHTSELQSRGHLVCRLLLEKKNEV